MARIQAPLQPDQIQSDTMVGFFQRLLGRRKQEVVEQPLEELTTTIAYPDGTKRNSYSQGSSRGSGKSGGGPKLDPEIQEILDKLSTRHPQVAEKIALAWGSDGCDTYLNSILFDERVIKKETRYQARAGFADDMMQLLMHLQDEHQRRYGPVDKSIMGFGGNGPNS